MKRNRRSEKKYDWDGEIWENQPNGIDLSLHVYGGLVIGASLRESATLRGIDLIGLEWSEAKAVLGPPDEETYFEGDLSDCEYQRAGLELTVFVSEGIVASLSLYNWDLIDDEDGENS